MTNVHDPQDYLDDVEAPAWPQQKLWVSNWSVSGLTGSHQQSNSTRSSDHTASQNQDSFWGFFLLDISRVQNQNALNS